MSAEAFVEPEVALYERLPSEALPDAVVCVSDLIAIKDEFRFSEVPAELLRGVDPKLLRSVRAPNGRYYGVPLALADLLLRYQRDDAGSASDLSIPPFPYHFIPLLQKAGAIDVQQGEVSFNEKQLARAFDNLRALKPGVASALDCRIECALDRFLEGSSQAGIFGLQSHSVVQEKLGGHAKLGALGSSSWVATYSLVFPNLSLRGKNGPRLRKLVRALLDSDRQRKLYDEMSRLPVTLDAQRELFASTATHPEMPGVRAAYLEALPMPNSTGMTSFWAALQKSMVASRDPKASSSDLAKMTVRLYSEYQRRYREHRAEVPRK